MRRAGGWVVALVVGVAAVAGLIALLQSRDESALDQPASGAQVPGKARTVKVPAALERELERGNVVLLHRAQRPPAEYAGEADPALAEAGQAVITRREPGLGAALTAVSAEREQAASGAGELREFVDYWLGGR